MGGVSPSVGAKLIPVCLFNAFGDAAVSAGVALTFTIFVRFKHKTIVSLVSCPGNVSGDC